MLARIIAFVIPLGFDTLAVAIALGLRGIGPFRPALVFAAFENAKRHGSRLRARRCGPR